VSSEFGRVQSVAKEVELIRTAISNFTHVKYGVKEPEADFPPPSNGVKWFLRMDDLRDVKRAEYAVSIWEDGTGSVWIQSAGLGDLAELVSDEYGIELYRKFAKLNLDNFSSRVVRERFATLFPTLGAYLAKCDESVKKVSSKTGLRLQMKFSGGFDDRVGEYVLFWMVVELDVRGLDLSKKIEKIEIGLNAMREALQKAGGGKWPPLNSS
jgi:hypothetical protein